MEKEMPHIGKLIQKKMSEEGRKAGWLANTIFHTQSDIYWLYQQQHISVQLLISICIHLKTDFFAYYSEYVRQIIPFCEKLQYIEGKIHFGKLIQIQMEKEGRKVKWLADKIYSTKSTIYRIYKREHIDIEQLILISIHLETDFFAYCSEYVHRQIQKECDILSKIL